MSIATETDLFNVLTHNGRITIKSLKTGEHRTLEIKTVQYKDGSYHRIVSLLRGSDNESDYTAFGEVWPTGCRVWRKHAESKRFCWFAKALNFPAKYLDQVEFYFEGKCRRCNRTLTTPESIESGIGPVCAGR